MTWCRQLMACSMVLSRPAAGHTNQATVADCKWGHRSRRGIVNWASTRPLCFHVSQANMYDVVLGRYISACHSVSPQCKDLDLMRSCS